MNAVRYDLEDLPHDLKDLKFKHMNIIQYMLKDLRHDLKELKFKDMTAIQYDLETFQLVSSPAQPLKPCLRSLSFPSASDNRYLWPTLITPIEICDTFRLPPTSSMWFLRQH